MRAYELWTKFELGGPIGDYIGFWRRPIMGYATNLSPGLIYSGKVMKEDLADGV